MHLCFSGLGFFRIKGPPATEMPPVNNPVTGDIGYHVRSGNHDVKLYDWLQYLDFVDNQLKKE